MISLQWEGMEGEVGAMMKRFSELPRHIAKKHLKAAVKRAMVTGVKVLKANTPVRSPYLVKRAVVKGTLKENFKKRGGALRRAAIANSQYKGRNRDGFVVGRLGYKFGFESRKAIWLEYGTSRGIEARGMIEKTMKSWVGPAQARLLDEMARALEAASRELAAGVNPGMSKRGLAAGVTPRR